MGSKENYASVHKDILSWDETRKVAHDLRQNGIKQFINLYKAFKDRDGDPFLWGDETEYFLVKIDKDNRKVCLSLRAEDILEQLQHVPRSEEKAIWKPEYGAFQIEGIPLMPYSGDVKEMVEEVEANMKMRREVLKSYLQPDEHIVTITTFPRLGCKMFTHPPTNPNPTSAYGSRSIFISDETISKGHPRFLAGANNIRERRQEKVAINIPIYKDKNSVTPFVEDLLDNESQSASKTDHIYMDCMTFGCACSLQVTMQAKNLSQAKLLYDQLAVMCPIILALSAGSPVHKGYLSNVDCRWDVLSGAKDDRTKEERNLKPLKDDRFVIPKSRHDSIDYFLSLSSQKYNDIPLIYDHDVYQQLKEADVEDILCRHVAHLFIRDPITLLKSKVIPADDPTYTEHFENLQSTNWQSMRLKPPPFNSGIGWRVEFRTCEVQVSDYENASFALFLIILSKVIIDQKLNLLLPLSKVEENMRTAQKIDAVVNEKFWFRNNITNVDDEHEIGYSKMSVDTIVNGNQSLGFPGLIPLISGYIVDRSPEVSTQFANYLQLISERASGRAKTMARWTRDFIHSHPAYKHDSLVNDAVTYDLIRTVIQNPKRIEPDLNLIQCSLKEMALRDMCSPFQCQLAP